MSEFYFVLDVLIVMCAVVHTLHYTLNYIVELSINFMSILIQCHSIGADESNEIYYIQWVGTLNC